MGSNLDRWDLQPSILPPMKKELGVVTKNSEILTEMSKKVKIPLLWRCNLYSKKQSTISQPILCWTWWDSVQVKSYPRCFGTPNLILIRWEMTEIWDLVRFTHTSAKLIEIQQNCLSKIHILHDLGSHMESNDTLHGSELVPHSVLGPKSWKFGPMAPKIFAQFFYTKLVTS